MEAIILISPIRIGLEAIYFRLKDRWRVGTNQFATLFVESPDSHLYISIASDVTEEYEPQELERIRSLVPEPHFVAIEYRDLSLLREVLELIAMDSAILVDNDRGELLAVPEFIQRLSGGQV